MAIPLNQFLNQMSTNQLRTQNMYELEITTGYPEIDDVFQHITMYAEGFQAPNRSQEYIDVGFKGFTVPVPTVMKMEQDHSLTVRSDQAGEIRRAFLAWAAKVADPDIEAGSVFAGDRTFNTTACVRLKLLASDMQTVIEVIKLVGVKVGTVGVFSMSNNDSAAATFEVSLKSVYWKIEDSADGKLVGQV